MRLLGLAFLMIWGISSPALGGGRAALVIGNASYASLGALANPERDAHAVADMLTRLGFTVVTSLNADHQAMLSALQDFGSAARDADVALVFYAGHGLQANGRNYLLPVSAVVRSEIDLPTQAIKVADVMEVLDASGAKVKLLILDACRNNPLPATSRAASRGLARVDASAVGTLVAFATGPNEVSQDGDGEHSPFATALLAWLPRPGIEIRQMLQKVRQDVYAATGKKQVPWVDEALLGDIYLAGPDIPSSAAPQRETAGADADIEACRKLDAETTRFVLQGYLDHNPNGYCAGPVRQKLAALGDTRPVGGDAPLADATASPATGPPPAPTRPYAVSSYWDHNGSLIALSASDRRRLFYYEQPRAAIAQRGVAPGTLLFKGEVSGDVYSGIAYVFSRDCGPLSYPVRGDVSPDRMQVTLYGRAPRRDDGCRVVGTKADTLIFTYQSKTR